MKKKFNGKVVSKKLDKTITVKVTRFFHHSKYKKLITRSKKFLVHDPKNLAKLNDSVEITEVRPISARKKFMMTKILNLKENK